MYGFHSQRVLHLTAREIQVCELVSKGLANKEIALDLGLTTQVVKHYLSSIYCKLQLSGRVQLGIYWGYDLFQLGMKEQRLIP